MMTSGMEKMRDTRGSIHFAPQQIEPPVVVQASITPSPFRQRGLRILEALFTDRSRRRAQATRSSLAGTRPPDRPLPQVPPQCFGDRLEPARHKSVSCLRSRPRSASDFPSSVIPSKPGDLGGDLRQLVSIATTFTTRRPEKLALDKC